MTEEPAKVVEPAKVEEKEVVPEVVEYLCAACNETTFLNDFVNQKLARLDITFERLPDSVPDDDGILWAVLCQGIGTNTRHLASMKVTRHAIKAPIPTPVLEEVKQA